MKTRTHVMASVKLDVATHARVSAAASLEGVDKSAWMSRVISEAVSGLKLIDNRNKKCKK